MALSLFRMMSRALSTALFVLTTICSWGQLVVNETLTPAQLVQNVLLGGGVSVSNITFNGVPSPVTSVDGSGSFTQTGNLGLDAGVILSTGFASSAIGPEDEFSGDDIGNNGDDPDLESIVGGEITNYSILEFDFIPTGDSLKFRYVFGSEEYPSFVCSFNDVFGFFLSGPGIAGPYSGGAINIAVLPDGVTPVTISNVNGGAGNDPNDPFCPAVNPAYYVNNTNGATVCFGGFTTVLTAFALVQCGETYHIKLAVADAGGNFDDTTYDSAVFLEAGSFTSTGQVIPTLTPGPGVVGNTINEGCVPVELTFERQGDLSMAESVQIAVSGSATPGVDYLPALPTQLDFAAEDSTVTFLLEVPLDDDGPEDLIITITQLVVCANTNVETVFTFNIVSPDPLTAEGEDVYALCGDVNVLAPIMAGGVGAYEFLWSTGETTPSITVSPEVTTAYDFVVTDGCGVEPFYGTLMVNLPVYDPLVIEVSPATVIECLDSEQIAVTSTTGGNGTYTYSWSALGSPAGATSTITVPAPTTPIWYSVSVTEGCGDTAVDSVLVTRAPLDPIEITTLDRTVFCPGDSTTLQVVGVTGGNGVYTYEWTNPQGAVVSLTDEVDVHVTTDLQYTITIADQCGMEGSATAWALLPNHPPFVVTVTPDHVICAGDSSELQVVVTGGSGNYFIQWADVVNGFTDPILKVMPMQTTRYDVSIIDQCGEIFTDAIRVEVEHVDVVIRVENLGQDDWHLRAANTPAAMTHVWDMGDGTRYRFEHVYHSYMDLEEHWASLRITTANGCVGTDSVLLKPPAHFYFPNAFTPDGDGRNDLFGPVGHDIDEFEMTVFNRWGEAIFTTTSLDDLWAGTVNGGDMATTGVYVYKYRATGLYFPSTEGYGHVTLLKGTQD